MGPFLIVTVDLGFVPCAELVYLVKLALLGCYHFGPVVAEVGNQAWVNGPLGNMSMFLGPVIYPDNPPCVLK